MNKKKRPENSNEALKYLVEGNQRFIQDLPSDQPAFTQKKMAELADNGQKPFAVVLTCSDSRSPVEMIFNQGLGDLFVIRVAGNVVAPSLLASIEFAAANFESPLILVMGHTQCGAIRATFTHTLSPTTQIESPHLEELISRIRPSIEKLDFKNSGKKEEEFLDLAVIENVKRSMHLIHEQSSIIRRLVNEGKIEIRGAILDIRSGKVTFES